MAYGPQKVAAFASMALSLLLGGCEHDYNLPHPEECRGWRDVTRHEHLAVLNNQKWCTFIWANLYGAGNDPIRSGRTLIEPVHGVLRITNRPDKTYYDYKPFAGYSGFDAFTIEPGPTGTLPVLINVEVKALPSP